MGYTGVGANNLRLLCGRYGKPMLDVSGCANRLDFNMARSAGYAAYVFARDTRLGIDIEQVREVPEMDRIVGLYFSVAEQSALSSLSSRERERAFFDVWTRKEALIKALGIGLFLPLDRFTISVTPGNPVSLRWAGKTNHTFEQWTIQDISVLPGFSAALAVEGSRSRITCRKLVSNILRRAVH
jgi:4'-phosphopantetheinyl transferase